MFETTNSTPLRTLAFDIENRPLAYWYDGQTTAEVTAIAVGWADQKRVEYRLLTLDPSTGPAMLEWFRDRYDEADLVFGHYIRRHDLPLLNGAMLEYGLPALGAKLTSDTQADFQKRKDLSASQESLAAMYGLDAPKHHMTQAEWRDANRLTPSGLRGTRKRVVDDVKQSKALRAKMIEHGHLKPPRLWTP